MTKAVIALKFQHLCLDFHIKLIKIFTLIYKQELFTYLCFNAHEKLL